VGLGTMGGGGPQRFGLGKDKEEGHTIRVPVAEGADRGEKNWGSRWKGGGTRVQMERTNLGCWPRECMRKEERRGSEESGLCC